jgi:hypothetical protein
LSARNDIQKHPYGRGVLHNDGDGDAGSLDGNVIEIIRRGHSKHAEYKALDEIRRGEFDALPAAPAY